MLNLGIPARRIIPEENRAPALPEFDKSKYDIDDESFDHGGEGSIYRARRKVDGKMFALKELNDIFEFDIPRQKRIYEILQEDEFLRNMIPESQFFQEGKILMEFIAGVTETEFVKRPEVSTSMIMEIGKKKIQFVNGLKEHQLIHVDLKSDNVMIEKSTNDVKMIDLQGIREASDIYNLYRDNSSADAISPEVEEEGKRIDSEGKMNVYATGKMIMNQPPGEKTPISKKFKNILNKMTQEDPTDRANAEEVLEMMNSAYRFPTTRKATSDAKSQSPVKNLNEKFDVVDDKLKHDLFERFNAVANKENRLRRTKY